MSYDRLKILDHIVNLASSLDYGLTLEECTEFEFYQAYEEVDTSYGYVIRLLLTGFTIEDIIEDISYLDCNGVWWVKCV